MDLNADGNIDILSGSYSRQDQDMAGLFQVLWGNKDGTFKKAEALQGTDGQPLIITPSKPKADGEHDADLDKICTRAFAVDLDGDGHLDIVSGNFGGTFALFRGEGKGRFAPQNTWLTHGDDKLHVAHHSDPFLIDWDGDGDFDMLSGSSSGGVFLFENQGSKKQAKFAAAKALLEARDHAEMGEEAQFGDAHIKAPQGSTRVWADDIDGDGKLDLLIGDQATVNHLAKGVEEAAAKKQLAEWTKKQQKIFESMDGDGEPTEEKQKAFQEAYEKLMAERTKFAREEMTGFVWLLKRK